MAPVIKARGLGKRYTIGGRADADQSFREMLVQSFTAPVRRLLELAGGSPATTPSSEEFWALRDVDFDVQQGEVLGIIGRNGAGKSTLLKILSRITDPTAGRVEIRGRVASLLEVGTGFHPELTGHENIYLNGAILGMSSNEISRKFDEIVAFAEIEKFINTPVKRYSSGMYVRLAFAVAAHLEPEILIVDEVLAVGDAQFQKKCLGKMQDVGKEGRTVLFVSHNLGAIRQLCSKALLLVGGRAEALGDVDAIVASYLDAGVRMDGIRTWEEADAPGDDSLRLLQVAVPNRNGVGSAFADEDGIVIEIHVQAYKALPDVAINIEIASAMGGYVLHTISNIRSNWHSLSAGSHRFRYTIPPCTLAPGQYSLSVAAAHPYVHVFFEEADLLNFVVESHNQQILRYPPNAWRGVLSPLLGSWEVDGHAVCDEPGGKA